MMADYQKVIIVPQYSAELKLPSALDFFDLKKWISRFSLEKVEKGSKDFKVDWLRSSTPTSITSLSPNIPYTAFAATSSSTSITAAIASSTWCASLCTSTTPKFTSTRSQQVVPEDHADPPER